MYSRLILNIVCHLISWISTGYNPDKISNFCFITNNFFHLHDCICARSEEDEASKKEDEDVNEDKEVKVVHITAKHLDSKEDKSGE